MYVGVFPDNAILSLLGSLGAIPKSASYLLDGGYEGAKVFPWGYMPILGYGLWIWASYSNKAQKIVNITATSILLALGLAWFFASIPIMQTRMFDFYILPLVLLAGNPGKSKSKVLATCVLAVMLYLRLEIVQDWILG
jgi:hypothetical protein